MNVTIKENGIKYESDLEEVIETLQNKIEEISEENEMLNCKVDSYEFMCNDIFEQMVLLKAQCETKGASGDSDVVRFLTRYINQLYDYLPDQEEDYE